MKKYIIYGVIILIIIVSIIIGIGLIFNFFTNKIESKLIKQNELLIENNKKQLSIISEQLKETQKQLTYIKEHPVILEKVYTEKTVKELTTDEKDKTILTLQDKFFELSNQNKTLQETLYSTLNIADSLKKDLKKTTDQLEKSNNALKKQFHANWGIEVSELANIQTNLNYNLITEINFKKYFFDGRFYISGGLNFIYTKNINNSDNVFGGGIQAGLGIIF